MGHIANHPETEHPSTIGEVIMAKLGGRREYGRFLDAVTAKTRRPRKRRKR